MASWWAAFHLVRMLSTQPWPSPVLTLGQRLRRWPNVNTGLGWLFVRASSGRSMWFCQCILTSLFIYPAGRRTSELTVTDQTHPNYSLTRWLQVFNNVNLHIFTVCGIADLDLNCDENLLDLYLFDNFFLPRKIVFQGTIILLQSPPSKQDKLTQCRINVGLSSSTLGQH